MRIKTVASSFTILRNSAIRSHRLNKAGLERGALRMTVGAQGRAADEPSMDG